jgi:hypothetical protein
LKLYPRPMRWINSLYNAMRQIDKSI